MGEVFAGRYELVDPIGRGGVGAVWRAWDHRRKRYVAAKVLQQSDAHTLLRFVREQAVRIDHPHVLAPASWAADDDKVLFTMDLVGGGSLAHVIGDYGPLPARLVCVLLDQLLAGLAAVHAEGVVHRDIKPANILLEATGTGRPHLRLSDFGISMRKGEPRLTETNYVVGTPGYFAPEQMQGAEPDFPADLFAAGLVAVYLLEGQKPDAKALVDHFTAYGTPGAPQGVPEPLWQVLAGLLQPDPDARFRTATGARKALAAAVELLPEPAFDDEPVEIFDQLGPLPAGFGPEGPARRAPAHAAAPDPAGAHPDPHAGTDADSPADVPPDAPDSGTTGTDTGHTGTSGPQSPHSGTGIPGPGQAWAAPEAAAAPGPAAPGSVPHAPEPAPAPSRHTAQPLRQRAPQDHPEAQAERPERQAQPPRPPARDGFRLPLPAEQPTPPTTRLPDHFPAHTASPQYAAAPGASPGPAAGPLHDQSPTRQYTAPGPGVPLQPAPARHAAGRPRRPGPPPKVAVPVLIVALACLAVGLWALTQL
ncbi:protein kinase [Streptomyces sp. NPDC001941]|uniref:serine/threonine-protein kinase n=1 Tax=Streptomyces sp. NPDC001941 TaxID=3154659 RepID=UPI00331FF282